MGWEGVFPKLIRGGVLSAVSVVVLFSACSSNKSQDAAASPETLVSESVKNMGTMVAQATGAMMDFPGSVAGTKAVSQGQGWYCPQQLAYENDCLKITGACATQGARLEIAGTVEFKACLRETDLGLAAFSGASAFHVLWDMPPSCVPEAPDDSC
ncbi:MAG TPA: hypothetical protein VJP40_05065, partial [bacterium]|nr:hypothetical protein [bacterium]